MKIKPFVYPLIFLLSMSSFSACNEQRSSEETPAAETENKIPAQKDVTVRIQTLGNSMQEMRYDKEEIRVPANARVKVILENQATDPAMIHNIVFVKKNTLEIVANAAQRAGEEAAYVPDLPVVFGGSPLAQPGETVEFIFTAPAQSGEYAFVCTYPGHWQQMNGRFIVETVAEIQ